MISRFFIDRPVFANVIAIITILFGVVALRRLPVERYPPITPPTVVVSTNYPGANARVVADTVAAPIEQSINGVENMMYMSSTSSADGSYALTITFEIGTKLEDAQVAVQNRLAPAEPTLPEEVRRQGITVKKQSSNIIMAISLTSPTKEYDGLFLSNYATLRLRDELSRVPGVGEVNVRGVGAYAMRIWFDPDKLASRKLNTQDVLAALQRQNVQVAAGQVGQPPNPSGQAFQYTVTTLGRLSDIKQFEEIIVKADEKGKMVYLRDVAAVELGAQQYDSFASKTGRDAANILVYQLPGSNAVDVAASVRAAMEKVKPTLPTGVEYDIPFDTTKFVKSAIDEVYSTLAEAGGLVLLVILIFLQSWRALLVPATTVPVTIIGAFAFLSVMGFSINLLTLFGLVLAIGIVVDDAIVIVENATHHIERGLSPRDATVQAMSEVTGPVIAITLVLMAVFIPTAFLGGITGQLYRQFALTIAATAFISAINALTLKPAQCAQYLRPTKGRNFFTRIFDFVYKPVERAYTFTTRHLLRVWWGVLLLFIATAAFTGWWYSKTPTGFLPAEDQGYVIVAIQLPDAASLDRTREVTEKLNAALEKRRSPTEAELQSKDPAVKKAAEEKKRDGKHTIENWFVLGGFSLLEGTNAPNSATAFLAWTDWSLRTQPENQQEALVKAIQMELFQMQEAMIIVIVPPSIQGLGVAGGFRMQVEDREGTGLQALQDRTQDLIAEATARIPDPAQNTEEWKKAHPGEKPQTIPKHPQIGMVNTQFRAGVPQIYLNIDREKSEKMGVKMNDVFATLQANLGSVYVNDFNKFDRTYQVRVQAAANFRGDTNFISRLEVPGRSPAVGQPPSRVPLGTLLGVETRIGPQSITRYNLYPTATINGGAAPGASSSEAIQVMEQAGAATLPNSMGYEWTDIAFQEKRVGVQPMTILGITIKLSESTMVYGIAILLVYLVLAAQYESWILPFAVILVVPLGLLGVVAAVNIRGFDNNIYTQIGIVLIIALASKNAILIVEFARELRQSGESIMESALHAARMRFRPIVMTSIAFILGVAPLVFATGAGAASRQSLGTAVFGGMITSTVLAVFFVPAFFVAFQKLSEFLNGPPKPPRSGEAAPAAGH